MFDLIGKTVGPYRILEQVGEGGMAAVYKAYQPSMDRYIAVKVLPIHLSKDPEFTKRFQREARAIARLEHAHILPVYDYGEYEGITYIAMRYIKAGTLKDRMTAGRLPLDEINNLISQIGGALDYAHRMGVIHRDVKPGNVLRDDQGDIYLSDFGLARMMEPSQQLTGSGVGLGTPAYMSPEQGQGIKVDHRSDIYSLGIILYEMLTGRVPYEAETPMAVVFKHIHGDLPLPHTINPNLPEPIERVVLKALAKNPADRYQTAGEMVQALNFAVRMMSAETQKETVVDMITPAQQRQDVSIATLLQRLLDQPRGKIALTSGAIAVILMLGFLLLQLPGNVSILAPNATVQSTTVATTTQAIIAAPESSTYRKTVTVQADHGWEGTGVMIEAGQKIHLNYLSGVWRTASNYSWENGSNCNGTCVDCILRTAPEASLLVKVGGGDAACLGDSTFSSPTSGLLYLSFNDCSGCFRDNEGSLTVEIEVSNNTQAIASSPITTLTSTPLAFSTQLPTTPMSSSSFQAMIDSAEITYQDNFDNPLFPGWLRWGGNSSTLYTENGSAFFVGDAQLHRNHGLQENEACLVSMSFSQDGGFMLAGTPESYGSNWRAWGLMNNPDNEPDGRMQDYFQEGIGESAANIYEPFSLQGKANTVYDVLLWVKGPASFTVRVWEKDNPNVFGEKQFQMIDPENWVGRKWYCNLLVTSGTVQVSDYSELRLSTPQLTQTTEPQNVLEYNFDNAQFDGMIDRSIWGLVNLNSNCDVGQTGGVLSVKGSSNSQSGSTMCSLTVDDGNSGSEVNLDQLNDFKARIKISSFNSTGSILTQIRWFRFSGSDTSDANCGIYVDATSGPQIKFSVDGFERNTDAELNRWYEIRLTIDKGSNAISCYVDGTLFASATPESISDWESSKFHRDFITWFTNTSGEVLLDDLYVTK